MDARADRKQHRFGRRLVEKLLSTDSYGAVLLSIVLTYLAAVVITGEKPRTIVLILQLATVWLVFRVSHSRPGVRNATNVLLVVSGVIAILNLLGVMGESPDEILFAISCLPYFIAPVAIIRYVVTKREVDLETVLGAVAAYLLIGMFFAFAYFWLATVQSGPFYGAQGDGSLPDDLFFSFTTMTTIGFGSLVPAENPGQTFAVAEGVIGQLFLVVAVAKVIGSWQPKRMEASSTDAG